MARPLRIEYSGAFYHITSRGNERKAVFKSERDREKLLFYLGSATERYAATEKQKGQAYTIDNSIYNDKVFLKECD